MKNYKEIGKKNRQAGRRFEAKVRDDLESKGWIVDKWSNNVDFDKQKYVPAKSFMGRTRSNGFPDFICFRRVVNPIYPILAKNPVYELIAVECKVNGRLSKTEKEKCKWLLDNNIFSKILVASRGENRGEIVYKEVENDLL